MHIHFVDLPSEIILIVLKQTVSFTDKLSVILTCSRLYRNLYLDVVSAEIRRVAAREVFGVQERVVIPANKKLVVGRAVRLGPGLGHSDSEWQSVILERYRPFVFVESSVEQRQGSGTLIVKISRPRFLSSDKRYHRGDVLVEKDVLYVYRSGQKTNLQVKSGQEKVVALDWVTLSQGTILRMTAKHLRTFWCCPMCHNRRYLCHGCNLASATSSIPRRRTSSRKRPPPSSVDCLLTVTLPDGDQVLLDQFTRCGWRLPCPRCVGAKISHQAKVVQNDWGALKGIWEELIPSLIY